MSAGRAYYDLTGLPPSHDEVAKFQADDRLDAWQRVVDEFPDTTAVSEARRHLGPNAG